MVSVFATIVWKCNENLLEDPSWAKFKAVKSQNLIWKKKRKEVKHFHTTLSVEKTFYPTCLLKSYLQGVLKLNKMSITLSIKKIYYI